MAKINKTAVKAVWHACDLYRYRQIYRLTPLSIHDHVVNLSYGSGEHLLIIGDLTPAKGPAAVGLSDTDFLSLKKILSNVAEGSFSKHSIIFESSSETIYISWKEGRPVSFSPERFRHLNRVSAADATASYLKMLTGGRVTGEAAVLVGQEKVDNLFRKTIKLSLIHI